MQNLSFLQLDRDVSYQTYVYILKVLLSVSSEFSACRADKDDVVCEALTSRPRGKRSMFIRYQMA